MAKSLLMSYKMPLKQTTPKSKWMTVALVCVYIVIGVFIVMHK